ncbi:MAG: 16S rRNA (adenine(1518)-N(6)/adenine(1519)-N(6))-dimethyltransferase RsmA [Clostridia bacterium]|nr:16S rRNA (adenine(1518)-N(6)/adenine(1519)-N(6))-dimethyltransferase RsmA [Clostridia bacterium]
MGDHDVTFSKGLGQNFLINPTVCPRMAEAVRESTDGKIGVLEIGAGVGVLTKELLERCDKVVCVELDTRLFPVLNDTLSGYDNLTLINEDILKADLKKIVKEHFDGMEVFVCANLPYYITSPVIMRLLEEKLPFSKIIVMVQKEAGDRLCAKVGSRESGAVTVAVNYYAEAKKLFDVSRGSFFPSPKVDSCVIQLDLTKKGDYNVTDESNFFKMVKSAFAQRRKTILNSVSSGMGIPKEKLSLAIEKSGLSPTARAEALTMEELVTLSNNICEVK